MIDIALDKDTHDIYYFQNDIHVVNNIDNVEQHIKIKLLFYLQEWFLDTVAGLPFYTDILIKNPNIPNIDNIIKSKILDTPNVQEILEFDSIFNNSTRKYDVTFKVRTDYGDTSLLLISLFGS
jgi:hypothetical protein